MPVTRQRQGKVASLKASENAIMPAKKAAAAKRKAEIPLQTANKKRSVFGDVTNATTSQVLGKVVGKATAIIKNKPAEKKQARRSKRLQEVSEKNPSDPAVQLVHKDSDSSVTDKSESDFTLPSSSEAYVTAGEETQMEEESTIAQRTLPEGVTDFDRESWDDPYNASCYAMDIFEYYKQREANFQIQPYLDAQPEISIHMRSVLVDWLVEVQESFELNHETLYLSVKIVDMYLSKTVVAKDLLQLVGATSVFIACKFDERCPPYVDDFLYICDDAYSRSEMLALEIRILKTIGYDLGFPLSYRFLRRYARVSGTTLELLTLARYILETSLMKYDFVSASDSLMAASALLLALKMSGAGGWTPTLEYYSGYKLEDIFDMTHRLHAMLCEKPGEQIKTIKTKYSHRVFYEAALKPVLDVLEL